MKQPATELARLIDRYRDLCDSPENRRRLDFDGTRFTILPEFPLLAAVTGMNLRKTYLDPADFLRFTLAHRIYRFERWADCTPLEKDIAYWPGVILETSLFGMDSVYPEGEDPWIAHKPSVRNRDDAERLRAPFNPRSGIMRRILDMSEYGREHLPDFTVRVQAWDRAPIGTAFDLVGTSEFLVATVDDPELLHAVMKKVTESQFAWMEERRRYLAKEGFSVESSISPGTGSGSDMLDSRANLIADELNRPMMSPAVYEEFIHPYDKQVVERFGGLNYFHSCGCLTPFLAHIARFRPVTQHISYWTSLEEAVRVYAGSSTHIQKTLHPLRDVLEQNPQAMKTTLCRIRRLCEGAVPYSVIANGIDAANGDVDGALRQCDAWVRTAATVFGAP